MIHIESPEKFLLENEPKYPNLDRDFILQICFEHPDRFNALVPGFDPNEHSAVRLEKNIQWVYGNVRYDQNQELDFWYEQFDLFRMSNNTGYQIFSYMIDNGTWPFPPVIIKSCFAEGLGAASCIGTPYHLIEGTHRISYARRMLEIGLVEPSRLVEIIEILPT